MVSIFACCLATLVSSLDSPKTVAKTAKTSSLPDFIYTIRAYLGTGYDDFQIQGMKELGFEYVQGLVDFSWINIERRDKEGNIFWKWGATDEAMDRLAKAGMKTIAFVITPKLEAHHWDEKMKRTDPRYIKAYGELAYQITKRYHKHPAWSGLVCVWGGSSDVFGEHPFHEPQVQVPLLNAAYEGIKRADPSTIVVSFNLGTTAGQTPQAWAAWHKKAFALGAKFDWLGVQSHGIHVTRLVSPDSYGGVMGLVNVRKFLDANGYARKPIWLNEGGFMFGEDNDGFPEDIYAEQVVQTFIVARTLKINLRGWVFFEYFGKEHKPEDYGLMSPLDESDPPKPRKAWYALQTLAKKVGFFNYQFERKISGEPNKAVPYVLSFSRRSNRSSKLWIVFSPRATKEDPLVRNVVVNIAPAKKVLLIDMLGKETTVNASVSGVVKVTSTSSPIYLQVN